MRGPREQAREIVEAWWGANPTVDSRGSRDLVERIAAALEEAQDAGLHATITFLRSGDADWTGFSPGLVETLKEALAVHSFTGREQRRDVNAQPDARCLRERVVEALREVPKVHRDLSHDPEYDDAMCSWCGDGEEGPGCQPDYEAMADRVLALASDPASRLSNAGQAHVVAPCERSPRGDVEREEP